MKDGGDLDDVVAQAVDDSVATVDDLADRFVAKPRHDTSRAGVVHESFYSSDDPVDDKIGVVSGVAGNVGAYCLDVLYCLGCPDDLGHRSSRRFASA